MRSETPLNVISEKTSYRKILGHSSIYVAGVMISKLVGFVMIPIYTHYLSPADYGTLELLSTTTDVLAILIGIGLAQAVLRFYYDFNDRERQNEVVSTALIASIVCFLIIFGLLTLRSDFISKLVFGSKDLTYYFQIMFISMVFSSGIEIPLTYLRAQQRSVYFVTVNLVRLIIQLSLNIYFIVVLGYGVLGVLYSGLIASVLIGIYMTVVTLRDTGFNFSFVRLKDLFRFGYPLIFSHLGAFVLTYSDRYFLKHFADLTEVGIYSLAYKFGMIVSALLIVPFHQFWMAEMFAVAKREDAHDSFRDIFTYSTFLSILFCFVLSVFIPEIIRLVAPETYWRSYTLVPLICLSYIFFGMQSFASCGILISKKTRLLAYSTLMAVVVNVVLNFVLIARWGALGAAMATIGAFVVRFLTSYWFSQREFRIDYEWGRLTIATLLATGLVIGSLYLDLGNLAYTLAVKVLIVLVYLVILFVLGWFKPNEKKFILSVLKSPKEIPGLLKRIRTH